MQSRFVTVLVFALTLASFVAKLKYGFGFSRGG